MNHTCIKMNVLSPDGEQAYAFMDEIGKCFIIVYGENRRKSMIEYLNNKYDPLNIKYKIVNIK